MTIKQIQKILIATTGALMCLLINANNVLASPSGFASNRIIDLVGIGSESIFLFSPEAANNQFKGTIFSGRALLYPGGTLHASDCAPLIACGVVPSTIPGKFVPEFPDKVIGHVTLQARVVTAELDKALSAFFTNDLASYLTEAEGLSGRIVFEFTGTLNFNNSMDYLVPGKDTLTIHGYIVWGLRGERFNLAVTGGTGKFKKAKGMVQFQRLVVANASGANSFRIRLPKFR